MRRYFIHTRRAVTLLEVMLAMSLLVLLTSMTYWFYSSALGTRDRDTERARKLQIARVVLHRVAEEVRQVSAIGSGGRVGLTGQAERIRLSTIRVPSRELSRTRSSREEAPPGEFDLVEVEYGIARHPDIRDEEKGYEKPLGLKRSERRIPGSQQKQIQQLLDEEAVSKVEADKLSEEDQLLTEEKRVGSAGQGLAEEINWDELYSTDIKFIRFCYYDGYTWWDSWDVAGENPLPQLVMITIGFEPHPPFDSKFGQKEPEAENFCTCMNRDPSDCLPLPADQLATTVRVPQADPFFRSRITRETQSLLEQMRGDQEGAGDGEDTGDGGDNGDSQGGEGVQP